MSIGAVSLNSMTAQTTVRATINQWKQGLIQLSDSLQAGDLKGAQGTFKDLVALHQSNESSRQPGSGNSTLRADFKVLGSALRGGDLSASEAAFDRLRTDVEATRAQQGIRPAAAHAQRPADAEGDSGGTTSASSSYTAAGSLSSSGTSIGTILGLYA
jgi:hypothetical protein